MDLREVYELMQEEIEELNKFKDSINPFKARDEFESFYLKKNRHTARRNSIGDYVLPAIQDVWCGWYAAYAFFEDKKKGS